MRLAYKALFFMLALNLSSWLISQLPVYTYENPLTPFNTSQFESELNKSESIIQTWEWGGGSYIGDVMSALRFFWNLFKAIVMGFPDMLSAYHAPSTIVTVLRVLWFAYWCIFIVWFIGGRDLEG